MNNKIFASLDLQGSQTERTPAQPYARDVITLVRKSGICKRFLPLHQTGAHTHPRSMATYGHRKAPFVSGHKLCERLRVGGIRMAPGLPRYAVLLSYFLRCMVFARNSAPMTVAPAACIAAMKASDEWPVV